MFDDWIADDLMRIEAISAGGEFVSVAEGLALIGRDRLMASDRIWNGFGCGDRI